MKNVFLILIADFRALSKQFFSMVIVIAILFIPALYAWFNIFSNWDPYGNTGNITIAVASDDKGYEQNGVYENMGETVLESLDAKDTINFVVYDNSDDALWAMESGEAYAAIILNEDFTRNMYDLAHALRYPESTMTYYENYKLNAVANKITESAASTVNKTVQTQYLEVLFETIFDKVDHAKQDFDYEKTEKNLIRSLTHISSAAHVLSEGIGTAITLCGDASYALDKVNTTGTVDSVNSVHNTITDAVEYIRTANWSELFKTIFNSLFELPQTQQMVSNLQTQETLQADTPAQMNALADDMATQSANMLEVANLLEQSSSEQASLEQSSSEGTPDVATASDEGITLQESNETVSETTESSDSSATSNDENAQYAAEFREYAAEWNNQAEELQSMSQNLAEGNLSSEDQLKLASTLDTISDRIDAFNAFLEDNFIPYFSARMKLNSDMLEDSWPLIYNLAVTLESVTPLVRAASETLTAGADTLTYLQDTLAEVANALDSLVTTIQTVSESEAMETILTMLGGDSNAFAEFFSCPITVNTITVFPIGTYGTAMAPFYSTLAIWVGCVVLAAVVKVHANGRDLKNVTANQLYWSRFIIYLILSEIQTFVIFAGDLWLLGIHCNNPGALFLCAGITSFVFVAFIYSLVVSFGDIGKAIVVIIMVLQIAGSSGTYPIEILSDVFEKFFLLFPFPYAINAMREAIAGMYQLDMYKYLAELMIFGVIGIVIGLFVRKPFMEMNEFIEEEMEETGVL